MEKNTFLFNSRRSPVLGRRGMVATSQPLAAQAGIQILNQGGSAADAAVATAAALNVTDFEIPRAPFARLRTSALGPDYRRIAPAEKEKAQRYYQQYYEYLKKSGWAKRAYAYLWDEPNLRENYEQVLVLGRLVHEAVPELKCLVVEQTYPHDSTWPDIDPAVDIWCPLWSFIERKTILEKIARGDEVWSYTALVQRSHVILHLA